jgi:DNA repair exonuclease SbcCD ATPase subunit
LKLENFRGIQDLEIDFRGYDTDIFGANGAGKTTVGNAICWLFMDRPMTEEPNFDPKTVGQHNLHHIASMKVSLDDGRETEFKKDFYEKWTKKRGQATAEFSGHTTDYYIDGVPAKEKEYVKAVEAACGVSIAQMKPLMILSYFSETMKIDERRALLFDACGDISDEEVISKTPELADLETVLAIPGKKKALYTTEQYLKIAKAKRAELNDRLKVLPARIDEAKKAVPDDAEDEDAIRAKIAEQEKDKQALLDQARQTETEDGRAEAIQAAIAGLNTELETKRAAYIKANNDANAEANKDISELMKEKNKVREKAAALDFEQQNTLSTRDRLHHEREALLSEYSEIHAQQWDKAQENCPMCGQELPAEKIEELRAAFNRRKSEGLARINERGQSCSQAKIQELEARLVLLSSGHREAMDEIAALDKKIEEATARLTKAPDFEDTVECAEIRKRIAKLCAEKLDLKAADGEIDRVRNQQIAAIDEIIAGFNLKLAEKQAAEKSKARVSELEAELRQTGAEMENIEHGIHLCEEFTRAKVRMVEGNINNHFKGIRFQLFKDQINGGLKETCDIMMPSPSGVWVEYKSANTAAQVNGSLEVIDFLNAHYGVELPVIMDKAGEVTRPATIKEQFIRLIVSENDKKLRAVSV